MYILFDVNILHKAVWLQISNIGCLNIHWTHVITNNSTNNNVVFLFLSDLKIVFDNNH